jgi:Domain of unknown function (DUF2019)
VRRKGLGQMTVEQLAEHFTALALDQDEATLDNDNAKFSRLFRQMENIERELKARSGDQRRALLSLYTHQNAQVRLMAAKATLAVTPEVARKKLEDIAKSHEFPQAGDAGMCLWALDEGIFKPT